MYQEKTIDITTGEETVRPYTAEEVAEVEAAIEATRIEREAIENAKAEKEKTRQIILQKLQLTSEEAAALFS